MFWEPGVTPFKEGQAPMTEQLPLLASLTKARRRLPKNPGRASRRKGHDWERELVRMMRPIFGPGVHRCLDQFDSANHEPDVAGCGPLFIEAKRGRQTNPRRALRQAEADLARQRNPGPYLWPLAICKDDGEPAYVAMRLSHFLQITAGWWQWTQIQALPFDAGETP